MDEWRFIRKGINLIHCSLVDKNRADMLEHLPLPFDEEILDNIKKESGQMAERLALDYWKLQEAGVFNA